jgi:DNA-binding MarR family transcriptional regulator
MLADRLVDLMGILHSRVAGDALQLIADSQLTLPQMVCLHLLEKRGPLTINGIADALHLSASAASHLVDRLFERGLVQRLEGRDDRRQREVLVSQTARELILSLGAARSAQIAAAVDRIDPELRNRLITVVEEVIHQLSAEGSPA